VNAELRELYQEVILDHYKRPHNRGKLEDANAHADGYNPLCGDMVHVSIRVENGVVEKVAFDGQGCAISTASASLMTDAIKGLTVQQADDLFLRFQRIAKGEEEPTEDLEDLQVLAGVRDHPSRIKCATLAWHTMHKALLEGGGTASTE
jgi:nitrogen fixation protein NifU and related proteins